MYKLIKKSAGYNATIKEFIVEEAEELDEIQAPVYSTAYVIEDGKWYILDSDGEWQEYVSGSGGGSTPTPQPETDSVVLIDNQTFTSTLFSQYLPGIQYGNVQGAQNISYMPDEVTITYDGVEYVCEVRTDDTLAQMTGQNKYYGAEINGQNYSFDFSEYPFCVVVNTELPNTYSVFTEEETEYTISMDGVVDVVDGVGITVYGVPIRTSIYENDGMVLKESSYAITMVVPEANVVNDTGMDTVRLATAQDQEADIEDGFVFFFSANPDGASGIRFVTPNDWGDGTLYGGISGGNMFVGRITDATKPIVVQLQTYIM